jgi:hypothetical protein
MRLRERAHGRARFFDHGFALMLASIRLSAAA